MFVHNLDPQNWINLLIKEEFVIISIPRNSFVSSWFFSYFDTSFFLQMWKTQISFKNFHNPRTIAKPLYGDLHSTHSAHLCWKYPLFFPSPLSSWTGLYQHSIHMLPDININIFWSRGTHAVTLISSPYTSPAEPNYHHKTPPVLKPLQKSSNGDRQTATSKLQTHVVHKPQFQAIYEHDCPLCSTRTLISRISATGSNCLFTISGTETFSLKLYHCSKCAKSVGSTKPTNMQLPLHFEVTWPAELMEWVQDKLS